MCPRVAPLPASPWASIKEGDNYTTLTDILGAEDAFGDMDFKVAGTADAITALQLDTKIDGIPADVLKAALDQAKVARLEILEVMNATIPKSRDEVAESAPKISTIFIPMDKIGEVIGPKGKVINTIQQETGADISVDDDGAQGIVTIGAVEGWRMEEARAAILAIVDPPKAEIGKTYTGRVVNITKFGAFVNILPGRDGLVHISKLGRGKRINAVEDVLSLGDEIEVTVEEIDDRGKVSLVPAGDLPEDAAATVPSPRHPSSGNGGSRGQTATSRPSRSRPASTPSSPTSSAISARPASARSKTIAATATTVVAATAAAATAAVAATADRTCRLGRIGHRIRRTAIRPHMSDRIVTAPVRL